MVAAMQINAQNQVVGVVTRKDLTEKHVIEQMRQPGFGSDRVRSDG